MSEFSFFRFRSCGLRTNEEVEHKDELVQLTEEVLHARGQEYDDSISKLSVSELKALIEQVRELRHKKKRKQLIKQDIGLIYLLYSSSNNILLTILM
jgi:hypothetical protein